MFRTLQEKIKCSFDTSATTYDQAAILQQQVADNLFDYIIQQQLNPKHVLELGAGTGYLSTKIEREFTQSNVIITDCADSMLAISKTKNNSQHVTAFAEALPFATQSHDLNDAPRGKPTGYQKRRSCSASGFLPWLRTYLLTTPQFPPSPTVAA